MFFDGSALCLSFVLGKQRGVIFFYGSSIRFPCTKDIRRDPLSVVPNAFLALSVLALVYLTFMMLHDEHLSQIMKQRNANV